MSLYLLRILQEQTRLNTLQCEVSLIYENMICSYI